MLKKRTSNRLRVSIGKLNFENPFILAASPSTANGDFIRKAFAMGWAGAVIKTIKPDAMEIADVSPRFSVLKDKNGNKIGFENFELVGKKDTAYWLEEIQAIKREFPEKILIASIMADQSAVAWKELAYKIERAGADAIELNFSCPHGMTEQGIGAVIGQSEKLSAMITGWVKETVRIPVIVKLTADVTDIKTIARQVAAAGADSIVAINTVQCLMGVDLDTMSPMPTVDGFSAYGGYSGYAVKPIGLRCVSQIYNEVDIPIYGVGGIGSWQDAVEYIAVGANVVQVCTAVMLEGCQIIEPMLQGLEKYMKEKQIRNLESLRGIAARKIKTHTKLNRSYIAKAKVTNPKKCTACLKCQIACSESGYNAIEYDGKSIHINQATCDGCSLCSLVCPQNIIKMQTTFSSTVETKTVAYNGRGG